MARGARAAAPKWLLVASVVVLVLTMAFMMFLVVLSVIGREVPADSRFLILIVLALGAGFGAAGLGGYATVKGAVNLPGATEHPVAIGASGGIAVMILIFLLRNLIIPPVAGTFSPDLRLNSLRGSQVSTQPIRVMVEAAFNPVLLAPDQTLVLGLGADDTCATPTRRARVDDPTQGTMTVFVQGSESAVRCGQLIIESGGRTAAAGPVRPVEW